MKRLKYIFVKFKKSMKTIFSVQIGVVNHRGQSPKNSRDKSEMNDIFMSEKFYER